MSDDITAMVKASIEAKIIEAFNDGPDLVEKLVHAALGKQVNEFGGEPRGYSETKMPYMEYLVGEEIRKATKEVISEYVAQHKDTIKLKVRQSLATADMGSPFAEKIADLMAESYNWSVQLNLTDKEK